GKIHGTKMFQSRRRAWKHKRAGTSQLSSLMLLVVRGGCFWNVWELTTATTRAIFLPAHRGYLLFLRQISSVSWLYARRYTARKSRGHSSTARSFRSGIPRTGADLVLCCCCGSRPRFASLGFLHANLYRFFQ